MTMKNTKLAYPTISAPSYSSMKLATVCFFVLALALAVMLLFRADLAAPGAESRLEILLRWAPLILQGFWLNLLMSFIAVVIGTVLGALLGIAQISPIYWLSRGAWLITEFFRNAPTLVLLFFCMFLLPFEIQIGTAIFPFPPWVKAVLGLSLSKMAYVSEIVRGGRRTARRR